MMRSARVPADAARVGSFRDRQVEELSCKPPNPTAVRSRSPKSTFRRVDAGRADLTDLMTEDVELYFSKVWNRSQ